MTDAAHTFDGRIEIDDLVEKGYMRHVLRLPPEVGSALADIAGGRVSGEVGGVGRVRDERSQRCRPGLEVVDGLEQRRALVASRWAT